MAGDAYELRDQPVLDELASVPGTNVPALSFDQLSFREELSPG